MNCIYMAVSSAKGDTVAHCWVWVLRFTGWNRILIMENGRTNMGDEESSIEEKKEQGRSEEDVMKGKYYRLNRVSYCVIQNMYFLIVVFRSLAIDFSFLFKFIYPSFHLSTFLDERMQCNDCED